MAAVVAAVQAAGPVLQAISAVTSVVSAIGEFQAGQSAKAQYELQARQAQVESERKSIQYQQRANDLQRRLRTTNAALAARAYAGGVDPFSGSPDIVRAANETAAGRDYTTLLADADAALRGGAVQAQIYESAGQAAARGGAFSAVAKLGQAAYMGSQMKPGTQSPAPVEIRQVG